MEPPAKVKGIFGKNSHIASQRLFSFHSYEEGAIREEDKPQIFCLIVTMIWPFLTLYRGNMDTGLLTGAFVDFRKAFHTIDDKISLDKLQLFGICGSEHL